MWSVPMGTEGSSHWTLIKVGTTGCWDWMDLHRLSVRVRLSVNLFLIYTAVPLNGLKWWPNQHCVRHRPATHTGKPLSPMRLRPGALAQESMCTQVIPDSKHSKSLILSQLGLDYPSGKCLAWTNIASDLSPGCLRSNTQVLQVPSHLVT